MSNRGTILTSMVLALLGTWVGAGCSDSDSEPAAPKHDASLPSDGSPDAALEASNEAGDASDAADASIPAPIVTGPITGGSHGIPFNSMPVGMAEDAGYTEQEFFVSGSARSYEPTGDFGRDGQWPARFGPQAPYKTRFIVRRPADAQRFNGTVIVEWLNVSGGVDADPDFGFAHEELLRSGYAYVGVTAQKVGIVGGGVIVSIPGLNPQALQEWDLERYGSLSHPGDDFSYDIYAQVGQLLRNPGAIDPLGGLHPQSVIAVGESQSAGRLFTYVAAVHPLTHVFDGFLIHSRGAGGPKLNSAATTFTQSPDALVRTDLNEPVLQFETETDLFFLQFLSSRQPDTSKIVTWEVAGTAHADQATLDYGAASATRILGDAGIGGDAGDAGGFDISALCGKINSGPQQFVLRKAVDALNTWVKDGTAPSSATPLQVETTDAGVPALVHDAHGNAKGGVRTPAVDAPIATYTGQGLASGGILCALFGTTTPFDGPTLKALYPTHSAYVNAVTAAAQSASDKGFLLAADKTSIVATASAAAIPP